MATAVLLRNGRQQQDDDDEGYNNMRTLGLDFCN